jgi:hypothetical protein
MQTSEGACSLLPLETLCGSEPEFQLMTKTTPIAPESDPASPYESLDSKKLHEAAERALDHYLTPAAQVVMLGELAVNQALDNVVPKE